MKILLSKERGSSFFHDIFIVFLIVGVLGMAVSYKKKHPEVKWGLKSPTESAGSKSGSSSDSLWGAKPAIDAVQQRNLNSSGMALRDLPPEKQGVYYRDHKTVK